MLSKQVLAKGMGCRSAFSKPSAFCMSEMRSALSSVSARDFSSSSSFGSSISQHRRRNSFSMSVQMSQTAKSMRQNSSSAPPASSNKKSVPMYSLEQSRVPPGMNEEELALDRFFSGYRPLFVLDHFQKNKTNKPAISEDHEYMPWDVSVSGLALNPEMKHIPRKVVRNLVPYKPAPTETEADSIETARQQQIDALLKDRQYAADVFGTDPENVKVFSFEINAKGLPKNDQANNNNNENTLIDENTEFSVFVDGELSSNPEILKSLRKVKDLLANPGAFDQVETPYIVESPASDSFGRIVYATSVKRKRKLKMNKHKLKKRRKLQRALRRKLNR